ncbi:tetratricopeptide repeat protein [Leptolyngbya sp. AN02str]|uniref:tetratricopeptide repeat protein n=1 Tax=Leptolyngbya sp. AN02str TaxID=3423363 RepID=UPI003D3207B0
MSSFSGSFNLIGLIGLAGAVQALLRLRKNWQEFWSDRITPEDRVLAQQIAFFWLVPLGVLLHEVGHSLATWQVGGIVQEFYWGFFWGYILPVGNFRPMELWWIALSGNLVSVAVGLVVVPFIPRVRRTLAEILYAFARIQLVYALIGYPLFSLLLRRGDWLIIYNVITHPYAWLLLVAHVGLVWGLWWLDRSPQALNWRLARSPRVVDEWRSLRDKAVAHPDEASRYMDVVDFLLRHQEVQAAQQAMQRVRQLAPTDARSQVLELAIEYSRQKFRQLVRRGKPLLELDLHPADRLRLHRLLAASLFQLRQPTEGLRYASAGLEQDPNDYRLRYMRSRLYMALRRPEEARLDLEAALESAPEDMQPELQRLLAQGKGRSPAP